MRELRVWLPNGLCGTLSDLGSAMEVHVSAEARFVGFVRNVMVRRTGIEKDALLEVFSAAGAREPRSYLSTGNVSFSVKPSRVDSVVKAAQRNLQGTLGRGEPIFVRSISELRSLAEMDPFPHEEVYERCITFCSTPWRGVLPVLGAREDFKIIASEGNNVFSVTYLVGGRPGTAGPTIEKTLHSPVTTGNWNTIERILRSPDAIDL